MIIIRLKSGFELPITCEKFKFSRSDITGEITNYSIEGIEDNKPLFFRAEDIECIWQKMDTLKMPYEWVPVSERLPDVGQKVLASTNKTCFTQVFKGTSGASNSSWWWEKKTIKHIVAWMPLPDPYKEDKT